jgi:hypothetical protein
VGGVAARAARTVRVEAAWAEYEELTEQELERDVDRKRVGRRLHRLVDHGTGAAAADRYRAAWGRWFDRWVERGSATSPGAR